MGRRNTKLELYSQKSQKAKSFASIESKEHYPGLSSVIYKRVWQGSAGDRCPYADQTVFSDPGNRAQAIGAT
jgi:hypothetical protein